MTQSNCTTFKNANDDESLYVLMKTDPSDIPSPYRELIDSKYLAFLSDPIACLTELASQTEMESLRRWFEGMCEFGEFGLIVHRADFFGNVQSETTICGVIPNTLRRRNFRLPTGENTDFMPRPLADLYRVTNGLIEENDAFLTSQFVEMRQLRFDFTSICEIEPEPQINLENVLAFYRSDTGNYLVSDEESAFSFCLGDYSFREAGSLTDLVESFFQSDLTGIQWNPFPYS